MHLGLTLPALAPVGTWGVVISLYFTDSRLGRAPALSPQHT